MSHQPVAVVGVGQTHHKKRRGDVSIPGLVREAAERALADANMDWGDIDAVVLGKAPDLFEGVMKPEMFLADALGANGKPMFRVHTAGSVGGSTGAGAIWRADSQELFYISTDGMIMAVPVSTAPRFSVSGPAKALFKLPSATVFFDVSRDGQRFLVPMAENAALNVSPYRVIVNWTATLD